MDNQHKQIKGYRDFDESTIDVINKFKEKEREVLDMVYDMLDNEDVDGRWMSIAKTDIQTGFMAAIRSIAKPEE